MNILINNVNSCSLEEHKISNTVDVDNTDIIHFDLDKYVIKKKNQNTCVLQEAKNRKITASMTFNNDLDEDIVENEYVEIENKNLI